MCNVIAQFRAQKQIVAGNASNWYRKSSTIAQ